METREIGQSGIHASVVGLGCNNFGGRMDAEASRKVIDKALDARGRDWLRSSLTV